MAGDPPGHLAGLIMAGTTKQAKNDRKELQDLIRMARQLAALF
jgi:hypothetical protein